MVRKCVVTSLLAALILLGGLSACGGRKTTTGDVSTDPKTRWLEGVPCTPPCWEDIQPGVTRSEEAIELLKGKLIIDVASLEVTEEPVADYGEIAWKFSSDVDYWEGKAFYYLEDDRVKAINLLIPDLCLREIIDAYGEPDYLLSAELHKLFGVVNLVWESHGFTYEAKLNSPGEPITGNVCNGALLQFSVGTPFQDIPSIYLMDGIDEAVVPWHGYGSYSE